MPSTGVSSIIPDDLKQEELFPIREVARLTGVNPITLRAWERRYGLIQPTRTDSGHRLYSHADIESVRAILGWIKRGVAVSKVGRILDKSNSLKAAQAPLYEDVAAAEWDRWQVQVRSAVAAFDEGRLERLYGQIFSSYPLPVVFQYILMPLWQELQLRRGEFGQHSEWLFLDTFLRARILNRLQLFQPVPEYRVLLAAAPGQSQELELLVAGVLLGSADTRISPLGIGQPLEELPLVCEKMRPDAVVLLFHRSPSDDATRLLTRLALTLDCPLALVGEGADLLEESLDGTPVACLGSEGRLMQRRLQQFLAGRLDT